MDGAYFIYLPLVYLRFEVADYECYTDDTDRDKLAAAPLIEAFSVSDP